MENFSPEILEKIIYHVPCENGKNWNNMRKVSRQWEAIATQSNHVCNPKYCDPFVLALQYLRDKNPDSQQHWWNSVKNNKNLILSESCVEVCVSSAIQFVDIVVDWFLAKFKIDEAKPVFGNLLHRACNLNRVDIVRYLLTKLDETQLPLTRSDIQLACQLENIMCLDIMLNVREWGQRQLDQNWFMEFLQQCSSVDIISYLVSKYPNFRRHQNNLDKTFRLAVDRGEKEFVQHILSFQEFRSRSIPVDLLFKIVRHGWSKIFSTSLQMINVGNFDCFQELFEYACRYGFSDIALVILDYAPHLVDINRLSYGKIIQWCIECDFTESSALILLEATWHQLELTQDPNDPAGDLFCVCAKNNAFKTFKRLLAREDMNVLLHVHHLIKVLLKKIPFVLHDREIVENILCIILDRIKEHSDGDYGFCYYRPIIFDIIRYIRNNQCKSMERLAKYDFSSFNK